MAGPAAVQLLSNGDRAHALNLPLKDLAHIFTGHLVYNQLIFIFRVAQITVSCIIGNELAVLATAFKTTPHLDGDVSAV